MEAVQEPLFSITCTTCQARLGVRDSSLIGAILECPKCGSMVQIAPPPEWKVPDKPSQEQSQPPAGPPLRSWPAKPSAPGPQESEAPQPPPADLNAPPVTPRSKPGDAPPKPTRRTTDQPCPPSRPKKPAAAPTSGRKPDPAPPVRTRRPQAASSPPTSQHAPAEHAPGESASEIPAQAEGDATSTLAVGPAAGSAVDAGLDLAAVDATAEPLPPPTRWASPVEQWWHRWVLWATAPVAGLVIVVAVWSMLPSRSGPSAERPAAESAEPAPKPQPAPPAPSTPEQPAQYPDRLYPRWLPEQTTLVVSFRPAVFAGWAHQQQIIESFGPSWERSVGRLVKGLGLKLGGIRRITWASTDLSQWPARSVAVVLLEQGHSTEPFTQLGKPAGFEFAGRPCRRIAGSGWEEPIAILDERLLLTGPEDLLRELARQAEQNAEGPPKVSLRSEAVSQLVVALPHDADLLCAADLTAAQEAGWRLPAALLDVWPELAGPWQTVWQAAEGMGLAARWGGPMRLEAAVVCDSETTVEKVSEALGRLTTQAAASLEQAAGADQVAQRFSARGLERQSINAYARFLQVSRHALQHAQWETADRVVWLRLDLTASAAEIAGLALAGRPGFRADWLLAARAADRARQQRLLGALTDYHHAHGRFPPGALGGAVLSPETRLSWIAAMLPYLGHEAWFDELKFGYPWNGPQNRAVTRRRLDAVINPALAQRRTEAGFPVTHYVGLAGVGAEAARLPADDPHAGVFGFARSAALGEIPDGASNTIAIMGVSDQLGAWAAGGRPSVRALTQPPYVNGPDGFGTGQPDGMLVGMADGSVRFISKNVDPRVVEMLATRAGGERVPFEALAWDMGDENTAPQTQPHDGPPLQNPAVPLVPADRPPVQEQPTSAAGDAPQPELVPARPLRPGAAEAGGEQPAGGAADADRPLQQPPAGPAPVPVDVAARSRMCPWDRRSVCWPD